MARFRLLKIGRSMLIGLYLGLFAPAYLGGAWYSLCGQHEFEQTWHDKAVAHVRLLRAHCEDPDLAAVLDYTLTRYSKVGAWDVMYAPCVGVYRDGSKTVGINVPHCPGLTLDTELFRWSPDDVALVLIHEVLHDWWPYYGHGHINEREARLRALSYSLRSIH